MLSLSGSETTTIPSQGNFCPLIFVFIRKMPLSLLSLQLNILNFESLININNSTMGEIVEFIIQEKLYNRYDTHKLLLGVLYAKAATYSDLESFINEWKSIPLYLKKCNAAKQTKTYIPEQKPQKIEITVPVVDLETKRKQQDQQRREEARKREERIEAQKRSYRNQGLCQHCGGAFKKKFIFFTSDICSRCGKKKDY